MLNKNRISGVTIYSDEWYRLKLGKITSSRVGDITQNKLYSDGFMSYIYEKVGEELTGKPLFQEPIEKEALRWGLEYENEAITKFGKKMGLDFVITQQLIVVPNTRYMGTPDALILHGESQDESCYNVSTVEVKCPPTFKAYIRFFLCKTPQDVKNVNSNYYWQVLDQMDICDCLEGYFVAYHPQFKAGNMNVVKFRKIDLIDDLKFLKERKRLASEKFEEIRGLMLCEKAY